MSLIDDMAEEVVRLELRAVGDGEGGRACEWVEGPTLRAVVSRAGGNSEAEEGEAMRPGATCVVTFPTGASVKHGDRIRDARGRVLRVTSDPSTRTAPRCASFAFQRVECEVVSWA